MSKSVYISLLAVLCAVSANAARMPVGARSLGLRIEPLVSHAWGSTQYTLKARSQGPRDPVALVGIRSELEFPLGATLAGAALEWNRSRWAIAGEFQTNLADPAKRMRDDDWIGAKHIAHSESDADTRLILATAGLHYKLRDTGRVTYTLLLQTSYEHLKYSMVGYQGWQGSLFSEQLYPFKGTAAVLDYTATYISPQIGAKLDYRLSSTIECALQAGGGVVFASDRDDHLLRSRESKATGWGYAGHSAATLRIDHPLSISWLTAAVSGNLRYYHAQGKGTQRWYRNDDMPAGTEIRDLPWTFESLMFGAGIQVGIRL